MKDLRKKLCIIMACGILCVVSACGTDGSKSENENKKSKTSEEKTEEESSKGTVSQSGDFVSEDGRLELTLPDASWECTVDAENTKTFQSDAGVINLIFADGEGIAQSMVPSDEVAYKNMVNGGMADLSFEVLSFERQEQGDTQSYKGTVHYTAEENPDKYVTHYGVYQSDSGYTITAVLFQEDTDLLQKVQNTIYNATVGN